MKLIRTVSRITEVIISPGAIYWLVPQSNPGALSAPVIASVRPEQPYVVHYDGVTQIPCSPRTVVWFINANTAFAVGDT